MLIKKYQAVLLATFAALALAGAIGLNTLPASIARESHVATTSDGVAISFNVYYNRDIPANRPLIVMGHGVIVNKEMMTNYAMELAARDFVVASIDWRGHGQSGGTLENARLDLDLEAVIAAVPAIVPSVEMSAIGLIGYSMGGRPTFNYAVNHTATVKAWIGVGTNVDGNIANETVPNNVLLIYGQFDEAFSLASLVRGMVNLTSAATPETFELGRLYGDIAAGTARQVVVVPMADHLTVPWDRTFIVTATDWMVRTFDGVAPDQTITIFDGRLALLVAAMVGLVGLVYALGVLLARAFKLQPVPRDEPGTVPLVQELASTSGRAFTGRYYAWTLLLLPSAIIPAATFLFPLFLTAFLTTLVGWCAINVFIYTWRMVRKAGVRFSAFVRENFLPGAKTWAFSAIMAACFLALFYPTVGLNYLGMMPPVSRLGYLIAFGAISHVLFWMLSTFIQKLVGPFIEIKARAAPPHVRFVLRSLVSFALLYSWFFAVIMGLSALMGSLFLAMILILMVPIFLLVGFAGTHFEDITGSPVPNALLHAALLSCIIVALSPLGSLMGMFMR